WYNQPTAQLYHVITDNRWPYWVYSGQQESGSVAVQSRGDYGAITWRDWRTVGVDEYGYAAPDPLNPDITYGGRITRYDWKTGQVQNIAPEALRSGKYRTLRTMPVIFSPVDKKTLYFATNVLWKTQNGGNSWEIISPDLTREKYDVPASVGKYTTKEMETMPRRGVIYTVAPSHQDLNTIWIGTDDGLIHRTTDGGKNWTNVTPPELKSWMKVSLMDASPFDNNTAYAAINTLRIDDLRPHIYRTHDGGKTWERIVNGIPDGTIVNVVREDPQQQGLLFAGTEQAVYVSFNSGYEWHPLRLNMPATSIRDLVIKDDDIVVGTHGRSFWILDDITPLRHIAAVLPKRGLPFWMQGQNHLFKPQLATRVRRSLNTDTPIPPEEPMGQNPPDGAILNYYLAADAKEVILEILDAQNKLVRRYSSNDQPEQVDENTVAYPIYWARPPRVLPNKAGMQRWTWDFHYPPPAGVQRSLGMQAILRDTPVGPFGPKAAPGNYTVKLTVDGKSFTQPLTLRLDPRVTTPPAGIAKMFEVSMGCYEGIGKVRAAQAEVRTLREQLKALTTRAGSNAIAKTIDDFDKKVAALEGRTAGLDFFGVSNREPGLAGLSNGFLSLMNLVEGADAMPTTQALSAAADLQRSLNEVLARWNGIKSNDIKSLNEQLRQAGLPVLAN
ncbi:MAG TPA: glycoside hydrolase, partial [Blastocatellia bacterium]|nr:glycoside hydrolase [Blastocatellia bacterium]